MHWELIALTGTVAVSFLLLRFFPPFRRREPPAPLPVNPYPYRKHPYVFTPRECLFFSALKSAVSIQYDIFAKMMLGDVLTLDRDAPPEARETALAELRRRKVDFLLCNRDTYRIACAIQLDPELPSKNNPDEFLEQALAAASLPLLRIPAEIKFDLNHIRKMVREATGDFPPPLVKTDMDFFGDGAEIEASIPH